MIDQQYFDTLITTATGQLIGDEVLLASAHSESTDFAASTTPASARPDRSTKRRSISTDRGPASHPSLTPAIGRSRRRQRARPCGIASACASNAPSCLTIHI